MESVLPSIRVDLWTMILTLSIVLLQAEMNKEEATEGVLEADAAAKAAKHAADDGREKAQARLDVADMFDVLRQMGPAQTANWHKPLRDYQRAPLSVLDCMCARQDCLYHEYQKVGKYALKPMAEGSEWLVQILPNPNSKGNVDFTQYRDHEREVEWERQLQHAATSIQRVGRGHLGRRRVEQTRLQAGYDGAQATLALMRQRDRDEADWLMLAPSFGRGVQAREEDPYILEQPPPQPETPAGLKKAIAAFEKREREEQEEGEQGKLNFKGRFPPHWGAPPSFLVSEVRPLPGGYGVGSKSLANWIQKKMDDDANNADYTGAYPNPLLGPTYPPHRPS